MRLLIVLLIVILLAVGGLVGFAYLGDMQLRPRQLSVPVQLELSPQTSGASGVDTGKPAETTADTDAQD